MAVVINLAQRRREPEPKPEIRRVPIPAAVAIAVAGSIAGWTAVWGAWAVIWWMMR